MRKHAVAQDTRAVASKHKIAAALCCQDTVTMLRPVGGVGAPGCCGRGHGGALATLILCWRRRAWPTLSMAGGDTPPRPFLPGLGGLVLSASSTAEALTPAGRGESFLHGAGSAVVSDRGPQGPRCSRGPVAPGELGQIGPPF
ncbi:hypothetical protein NDU88_001800 [Pleurodeles waltl]|uniref:Uncharacterized protein n=1 Tax=Pleurodeles waltl TaxID=8319 RepID=A0AAV7T1B9_PLEWA|nr:hypothetical protein NDU88_001800 [Pleurodeles waltl]